MIKINFKNPKILIYIICMILFTMKLSLASVDGFILGKVIFSETNEPVLSGSVKVFIPDQSDKIKQDIETVVISNGSFKITNNPILNTDGIKIMAYPNDVDNNENPFDPLIIDFKSALASTNNEQELILFVEKSKKTGSNDENDAAMLKQNFPNPFNPSTHITFDLENALIVSLKVYNMSGESIATLVNNERLNKGLNDFVFDASGLPSGIYVYSLTAGDVSVNKKMILLK